MTTRQVNWEQLVDALGGRCELFVGVGLRLAAGLPGGGEGLRRPLVIRGHVER